LGWPLFAPALAVSPTAVTVIRGGGLRTEEYRPNGPFVATLQPGVRGVEIPDTTPAQAQVIPLDLAAAPDAEPAGELAADPATVGLADAKRIVAAGAGLGSREMVQLTADVATALGASFGATRVVTDAGWAPIDRQIGTTGVVVDPDLYVALGISGAVQHVSGIGRPATVVAANTDASCPMMGLADLALVTDATALLRELATRLGVPVPQVQEARRG
jgi:electron transfer flavoprotein alpha subunit